ncbi:hypothetical protein C0Q70_11521 [Pomacea canaliculata]|uniref:Retrotransposon gag domain-containing protein n=1 Tax=Pomacea canaliculata TaxID=400727 RepID=A0A2T7P6B3_POMCA|nr:hypothetical protein C0Q70_11521 [Pomacea canaliculata]
MCLRDNAQQVLGELSVGELEDFDAIKAALERRFDPAERESLKRVEFRSRFKKKGESVTEYGFVLNRLAASAYPNMPLEARETIVIDQFVSGLPSKDLRRHVQFNHPRPFTMLWPWLANSSRLTRSTRSRVPTLPRGGGTSVGLKLADTDQRNVLVPASKKEKGIEVPRCLAEVEGEDLFVPVTNVKEVEAEASDSAWSADVEVGRKEDGLSRKPRMCCKREENMQCCEKRSRVLTRARGQGLTDQVTASDMQRNSDLGLCPREVTVGKGHCLVPYTPFMPTLVREDYIEFNCPKRMRTLSVYVHLQHINKELDNGTACPACDSTQQILSFDANFGLPINLATIEGWQLEERNACKVADGLMTAREKYELTLYDLYSKQSSDAELSQQEENTNPELFRPVSVRELLCLATVVTCGQEVAKKISKTVAQLNKQMKVLITSYNSYGDVTSNLPSALSFAGVSSEKCQQLIADQVTETNIDSACSRYSIGRRALLHQQVFTYEQHLAELQFPSSSASIQLNISCPLMDKELMEISNLERDELVSRVEDGLDKDESEDEESEKKWDNRYCFSIKEVVRAGPTVGVKVRLKSTFTLSHTKKLLFSLPQENHQMTGRVAADLVSAVRQSLQNGATCGNYLGDELV